VVNIRCGAVALNESCGAWGDEVEALRPGSSEVMVWLRKEEDPEPVCDRSVGGRVNRSSVNMDCPPRTGTKGGVRKLAGSGGIKELWLGLPDQEVAYSDGGPGKGWVGGGVDEWESEGELPSGEGSPKIAEMMEYSRLAGPDPEGKDGASSGVLNSESVGGKPFVTVNKLVRRGIEAALTELRIPKGVFGDGA